MWTWVSLSASTSLAGLRWHLVATYQEDDGAEPVQITLEGFEGMGYGEILEHTPKSLLALLISAVNRGSQR